MNKIRLGDKVQVIRGEDRPQTEEDRKLPSGEVIAIDHDAGKVKVEGCAMVWKHRKAQGEDQPGGRTQEEAFIDISNVMLFNEAAERAERTCVKEVDGKRVRWWVKSDSAVDA